jgi:hypothetical protein
MERAAMAAKAANVIMIERTTTLLQVLPELAERTRRRPEQAIGRH